MCTVVGRQGGGAYGSWLKDRQETTQKRTVEMSVIVNRKGNQYMNRNSRNNNP